MKLLISFVGPLISEFRWIIISDFALSRFPQPRSLQTQEKWEESAEEWHHVRPSSGRREREARPNLLHLLSHGVQRIQPIITFIFSPNFVGFETRAMQQSETPFCFFQFWNETKTRDFHTWNREIGILLDLYWKIGISRLNRDEWQVCFNHILKVLKL